MEDQIAVVTGGAQGIGHAVVEQLVEKGARVASWDIDTTNDAAMNALGDRALAVSCNITDPASINAALAETVAAFGTPTILVNSAGIAGPNAPLDEYDIGAWQQVMDININGTFLVNRGLVPGMKAQNYGRILNIASVAGKEGNPNASAYSTSKAGVIGLTKSLGEELAAYDIAVNCVTPTAARTRIFNQMS